MTDWQERIRGPHAVCEMTGQEIPPGEEFFSAIDYRKGEFIRHDFSLPAWSEQDPEAWLSWWKQRRPLPKEDAGPRLVDSSVLLELFCKLKDSADRHQQCFLWLVTLILVRGRKLRYLDLVHEAEADWLLLRETGGKGRPHYRIRDPRMTPAETERVKQDLDQLFSGGVEPPCEDPVSEDPVSDGT